MALTEFEEYILKNHPDPDSITMIDKHNLRNGEEVRVGLEWKQVVRLAEKFAEKKVIDFQKKKMIKNGLNSA